MHGTRATRGLIHGHRIAVRRVVCRVLQHMVAVAAAAASFVARWSRVDRVRHRPPPLRRPIPGRRVENSAFTRPVGARSDRPAFDRARAPILNSTGDVRTGAGPRPTRNLRARPKSMQLILITPRERTPDVKLMRVRCIHRSDNRPLIVLSELASWRHVIALVACRNIVFRRPDAPFTNIFSSLQPLSPSPVSYTHLTLPTNREV